MRLSTQHDSAVFFWSIVIGLLLGIIGVIATARAHEWSNDPLTRKWFQTLMQPDNEYQSCCGEADSYLSDQFEVDENGDYLAIITDERDDRIPSDVLRPSVSDDGVETTEPKVRQHRAVGTRIHVPAAKVGCTKPNPTGHGILFMPQMGKSLQDGSLQDGIDHSIYDGKGDPIIPYCYCPPTMG